MIWYLILFAICISPFLIYFVVKLLQKSFIKSKNYYCEAILVKKEIRTKEEIEKDIIFNEVISSKNDTTYTLYFLTSNNDNLEFNVTKEDFDKYNKDSKGKLVYKKYLGIPSFISFN